MRILLATDAWEPQVNGVVRTLTRVVGELKDMGDLVEVISPDQFQTFPLPTYPEIKLAMGVYERAQDKFKSFEPEAIHVATEGPIGLAARRICVEWKLPFTTSYHTRFPEYVSARLPVPLAAGYAYMRWFHKPSGRVMVATPTLREELARHGFRNLSQWSRGVDTELFHPARRDGRDVYAGLKRPIFLNVGRVAVEKNIAAFVGLDLPGTKVVVGDGPQREELAAAHPETHFAGARFGPELAAYYASADAFVFPSLTDTFGLVLLEAMASGTPVAAFSAAGPIDIIPGSGAGMLAPDQTNGLAGAALACLELDRAAVRAFAEQFSWRACAEEFRRNLQPYPEPEKSRFWRRLRRLARLRRRPRRPEALPARRPALSRGRERDFTSSPIFPISHASGGPVVNKCAANAGLGSTSDRGLREVGSCHTPLDLVRERSPERPVALVRPGAVALAARWFQENFKGEVLYAVKANPSPWAITTLAAAGLEAFDVASISEIELVRAYAPKARLAFMHPVKSRAAIASAYFDHGVRTYALDALDELEKIQNATGGAKDLNLIVRLAVQTIGAAYSLAGKFGAHPHEAPELLLAARQATNELMGVSFHVGSQCMRPSAYPAAMAQVSNALVRAGVFADVVDVGGGFPSVYPGMIPPDLSEYVAAIERGFSQMMAPETTELWCEPGRALCAEGSSLLTRVELRKGDALYLNDGSYGALFDAAHARWPFPVRLHRTSGATEAPLKPFRFFGPTCNSLDAMPGPFWLPEDVAEGDHVEIGMLGAYGVAMASGFNGFGAIETVEVGDPPMLSMFGLAPRSLATPRTDSADILRLPRAKARRRRRR